MFNKLVWMGIGAGLVLVLLWGQSVLHASQEMSLATMEDGIPSAFTYQGALQNSLGAIDGACDLRLSLFAQLAGGVAIAGPLSVDGVQVTGGLFSIQVDFGTDTFTGDNRWLEVAVRCPTGQGAYATLTPRQAINPVPYALYATDARQSFSDFTVQDELWVGKTAIIGGNDVMSALSLRAPDLYLNADVAYGRGKGGRALVHDFGNTLSINHSNDFAGGVRIGGSTVVTGELTVEGKSLRLTGQDFYINAGADRGDGGRALVHASGDQLAVNYENDFAGGVAIHSGLQVLGPIAATETVSAEAVFIAGDNVTFLDSEKPGGITWLNRSAALGYADAVGAWSIDAQEGDLVLRSHHGQRIILARGSETPDHPAALTVEASGAVSIPDLQTGGLVEANLQTADEQASPSIDRFEQGDVLCWDANTQALAYCPQTASPLVVAVANGNGKPMIAGVEKIKVTGQVQPGDMLVSAETVGYAVAWRTVSSSQMPPGVVIAKALEASDAESGLIQAIIVLQ